MFAVGTVTGMAGAYLCLVLLLLVARLPWLEREVGHPALVRLHRSVAPYALVLVLGHVALTTLSYAQAEDRTWWGQLVHLVLHSAWMVPAAAAFVLMMALGALSYRRLRERMRYETWWVTHLYFYVAVALSFGHQVALGTLFTDRPALRWFWGALYVGVAVAIVLCRVVLPLLVSHRHALRVAAVVPEAQDAVSVYLTGTDLGSLEARGGQFFQWRFLTRDLWWQAHPYSLSASPHRSWLRITVKDAGDHSRGLRRLRVGTRVVVEGPYGAFHAAARRDAPVVAFAAGSGIAPVRALLEDLPPGVATTIVYRVPDHAEALLRDELEALVEQRRWRLHYLQGSRDQHPLDAEQVGRLVPGLAAADVYVCGPDGFADAVEAAARTCGAPPDRVHRESFTL